MIGVLSGLIGISAAIAILILIRSDRLHVAHGLGWLLTALVLCGLGFAPALFDEVSRFIGVSYPPSLAFTLGFMVVIVKLLLNDIDRSRMRIRQQRLVQRMAILESEIRKLKSSQTNGIASQENNSDAA